jgi:hypothetical protein
LRYGTYFLKLKPVISALPTVNANAKGNYSAWRWDAYINQGR